MNNLLFYSLLVVATTVLVFVAGGLLMPSKRTFEHETTLNHNPVKVFNFIKLVEHQATWRTDVLKVEPIKDPAWEHGWIEHLKRGNVSISFKVTKAIPGQLIELELKGSTGFQGRWRGELIPNGTGTRLKATETIVNTTWIGKWIALFLDLTVAMELYAKDLDRGLNNWQGQ